MELRKAVDRLGRLVSDLLDIARIDEGLFDLALEPMDIAAVVRETADGLGVPGTTIEVDVPSEVPVLGDPRRLRQAIENLLANAVQHAPAGTPVSVRVVHERSDRDSSVVIIIGDRGTGIDPTVLPRLFDRFSRASESTGLGVGLHLAHQIAEAHGGCLEVLSSSANGTDSVWLSQRNL